MSTTLTSLRDISAVGSWTDLRNMNTMKLTEHEKEIEKDKLLDAVFKLVNTFDHKWLISLLTSQKMRTIRKQIQLESLLNPKVHDFIDVIVKSFGKHNPVSILCLALGAHSLFYAVKAQNQRNFSYNTLVDFILLVDSHNAERSQQQAGLSSRKQEIPSRHPFRP